MFVLKIKLTNQRNQKRIDRESWTIRQMVAPEEGRENPGQINESCNSFGLIESWTILKIGKLHMRQRYPDNPTYRNEIDYDFLQ